MIGGASTTALVGAGYWGSRLARNLAAADDNHLVAVHDLDPARAAAATRGTGARAVTSLAQLLDDPAIDAVAVATPSATHGALVRACLRAGKDVLVEKPLASSVLEAEALATLADADERVLACDQTYRFAPAVTWLRRRFAGGDAPIVRSVTSVRTNVDHGQPDLEVIWDLAYHDLVILDAVLPEGLLVAAVRARAHDVLGWGRPHRARVEVELVDGATAEIEVDWARGTKERTMRFTADCTMVVWNDLAPGDRLTVHGAGGSPECPSLPGHEPLALLVADFLRAVRERSAPVGGVAEELRVLRVLEAASASAAHDGTRVVVESAVRTTGAAR